MGVDRYLGVRVDGRISDFKNVDSGGSTKVRITYTFDEVGNVKTRLHSNGARVTYLYDAKNRLTQEAQSVTDAHTYDYSYDASDNRLTSTETGSLCTWSYDAGNRMVSMVNGANKTTYTYSANGNLTGVQDPNGDRTTMSYDMENRLNLYNGASVATYLYDGDGKKRVELTGEVRTTLIWDGEDYVQGRLATLRVEHQQIRRVRVAPDAVW